MLCLLRASESEPLFFWKRLSDEQTWKELSKFAQMVRYRLLRASIFRNQDSVYLTEFVQLFKNTNPSCKGEV